MIKQRYYLQQQRNSLYKVIDYETGESVYYGKQKDCEAQVWKVLNPGQILNIHPYVSDKLLEYVKTPHF